jgi:phospholipid/cholesterol/gamma-HCH transport system permease protein
VQRFKEILRRFRKNSDSRSATSAGSGSGLPADGQLGPGFSLEVDDSVAGEIDIKVAGHISMETAGDVRRKLLATIKGRHVKKVIIDLERVEYFDSSGAAILMEVEESCKESGCSVELKNVPDRIRSFMDLVDLDRLKTGAILKPVPAPNLLIEIGTGVQDLGTNARDIITFIGATVVALVQDLTHPRKLKWDSLWNIVERSGSDAVPIVASLSFLMGAVMAFQSAIQLRKFGANIFVADLVSLSICLEMGPLLTALIVAGRSGAAYAAQIGTMQVNEEIDALRVMAIDPLRYLVSPRVLAVACVTPCLVLFGDLMGTLGGCVVAAISVDITPVAYFNEVNKVLEIVDVLKGLIKSFVFGVEIAMIGCLRGFQVRGGAESVGWATTSAVVTSIFVITVTDAVFSVLYYYFPAFWNM